MKKENAVRYHEAWQLLCSSSGVLIPGGFGVRGMEGKILAAEWARKTKKPFLGNDRHSLNLILSLSSNWEELLMEGKQLPLCHRSSLSIHCCLRNT